MSNLRIKKKHIDAKAIDGSKIELLANEALKAVSNGVAVDLIKIDADGKVYAKSLEIAYSSDVSTEASARASADASLETRLSTEEADRADADDSLEARLSAEEVARASVDAVLSGALSLEIEDRASGDALISSQIQTLVGAEASARASAGASLETRLSTEEVDRADADDSLETRLSTEEADRADADDSLETRLSTEEANRDAADISVLAAAKSYVDDVIGVDSASVANFLNLAAAMEDDDSATGLINALASEASARASADASLETRLSTEEVDRADADDSLEAKLSGDMSSEASTRLSADNSLSSRIDALTGGGSGSLGQVSNDISTEASVRASADAVLSTDIASEISARSSAITAEVSARVSGDASVLAAAKAYVDDIVGVDSNSVANFLNLANVMADNNDATGLVDAMADIANGHRKESITLVDATHKVGGVWKITLQEKVKANSLMLSVGRLMVHQGIDYTLSDTTSVTVITFIGELAVGGSEELAAGDVIHAKYMK